MSRQHRVVLTEDQRLELSALLRRDDPPGLTLRRARILSHADAGGGRPYQTDLAIATATAVHPRTVARVRAQFVTEGFAATLGRRRSARMPTYRLDQEATVRVVHLCCSEPPAGRDRWSLRLLTNRIIELEIVSGISPETVRQTPKKTISSHG